MRLTLRTLLAYRDGVLSPDDREELHARIQKSEFAVNLLHRIDAVGKQHQLSAPPVTGKGLGSDANSVAEYLDDALPASQVPEMERVCLVSDAQLAELAHCHEVLATALTQKIGVPQSLSALARQLGNPEQAEKIRAELSKRVGKNSKSGRAGETGTRLRVDAGHTAGRQPDASPGQADTATQSDHKKVGVRVPMMASAGTSIKPTGLDLENSSTHAVPEYLLGTNRGTWRAPVAIGGLLAVLCVLVWQSIGPWDRIALLLTNTTPPVEDSQPTISQPGAGSDVPKPPVVDGAGPEAGGSDTGSATPPESDPAVAPELPPIVVAEPEPNAIDPDEAEKTPPAADIPGLPAPGQPADPQVSVSLATWTPSEPAESSATIFTTGPAGVEGLVAPGGVLGMDERFLVPASGKTTITMPGGLQLVTMGPTMGSFIDPDTLSAAAIDVVLGRALIANPGQAPRRVAVWHAGRMLLIELPPGSRVSLECEFRPVELGSIVEADSFQPACVVLALSGAATLRESKETFELAIGEGLATIGDKKPRKFGMKRIPNWLRDDAVRPVDRFAMTDLHELLGAALAGGETLQAALDKLRMHRRPETAALAMQTTLMLGNWNPLISGVVNNPNMAAHWWPTLELGRQLLLADQQNREAFRLQCTSSLGEEAGDAYYALVCGLDSQTLAAEGVASLVAALESKDLRTRVVAAHQLRWLTGSVNGFVPQNPKRESIQQWRRDLTNNRLVPSKPDDPIRESLAP